MKSVSNSYLRSDSNFITFVPRKNAFINGFKIFASSILMVFVILLEIDDVFYRGMYVSNFFFIIYYTFTTS